MVPKNLEAETVYDGDSSLVKKSNQIKSNQKRRRFQELFKVGNGIRNSKYLSSFCHCGVLLLVILVICGDIYK